MNECSLILNKSYEFFKNLPLVTRHSLDCEEGDKEVHHAEAEADPGQGRGPGLQPPGHSLGTAVPVPVTYNHRQRVMTFSDGQQKCLSSVFVTLYLRRGVCSLQEQPSSH